MPPRSGGILPLAAAKRRHVKHVKRTCPRGRYTLHFCLSQLLMFSLFDLQELCHDEDKLRNFLTKYGVLARAPTCHCGKPLKPKWFYDRGSAYRYCSSRACNRKIYGKSNGILEGSKLSLKQWTHLAYFWAHNSGGVRAEHMLALDDHTVSAWSERFRVCVMNWEARHSESDFGGKGFEVEADECEVGRKRKGLHGHETDVKGDFRGLFERATGRLFVEAYDKLKKGEDDRRFGPPTVEEVVPLVQRVLPGSLLFTDGARAYTSACKDYGITNAQVDHSNGEFTRRERLHGKLRVVSTQGIDGAWGRLKTFLRARGGIRSEHLESNVKEFQWRSNLPADADPFISLLECIKTGCFT